MERDPVYNLKSPCANRQDNRLPTHTHTPNSNRGLPTQNSSKPRLIC